LMVRHLHPAPHVLLSGRYVLYIKVRLV
jgi:hypothetical protein